MKEETASPPASTFNRQQARFRAFRQEYNETRPHEALGQVPPATVYQPSPRGGQREPGPDSPEASSKHPSQY